MCVSHMAFWSFYSVQILLWHNTVGLNILSLSKHYDMLWPVYTFCPLQTLLWHHTVNILSLYLNTLKIRSNPQDYNSQEAYCCASISGTTPPPGQKWRRYGNCVKAPTWLARCGNPSEGHMIPHSSRGLPLIGWLADLWDAVTPHLANAGKLTANKDRKSVV